MEGNSLHTRLTVAMATSQPAVDVRDCIEELVRFTLYSHLNDTTQFTFLNVSRHFCSTLLLEDPDPNTTDLDSIAGTTGIPAYPLYKRLASCLLKCMRSETFFSEQNSVVGIQVEASLKQKEREWQNFIFDKLTEIEKIVGRTDFHFNVQEPFFSQIKDGLKTVEGRCRSADYDRIGTGDLVIFNKCLVVEVQHLQYYPSLFDMLVSKGIDKVLPGVSTIEEGVKIYRKFYTEDRELSNGVLAISVSKATFQPYMSMASLFSDLGNEGIQRLLGLVHTTGTISSALPPPISTLLSSFKLPYNPQVKGSVLTQGARALAKHIRRSSNKYWGSLEGSDSNKNMMALEVIKHAMAHCCWLNIHNVPPHGDVFEIRDSDGYGARWSKDGSKFIGFLEPYMEDGHSKGWKH